MLVSSFPPTAVLSSVSSPTDVEARDCAVAIGDAEAAVDVSVSEDGEAPRDTGDGTVAEDKEASRHEAKDGDAKLAEDEAAEGALDAEAVPFVRAPDPMYD